MAPAMRVSSSSAPRSLRSLLSSDSGTGRSGKGYSHRPPTPPGFPGPGGLPSGHLLPETEADEGGGSSSFHPIFPSHVWWGGKENNSQALWTLLLLEAGQKGWGERERAVTDFGGLAVPFWGEGDRGYSVGTEPASGGGQSPAKPSSAEVH